MHEILVGLKHEIDSPDETERREQMVPGELFLHVKEDERDEDAEGDDLLENF